MKKSIWRVCGILIFLCSACTTPATPFSSTDQIHLPTTTPSAPGPTHTPGEPRRALTSTPLPPTLLPTIPTFTPTFDSSTVVMVTAAAKAACPQEDPQLMPDFPHCYPQGCDMVSSDEIRTYLNAGGSVDTLRSIDRGASWEEITDLTGDGVSEIVFRELVSYEILGCKDGTYQKLFEFVSSDFSVELEDILDLNKDGIPELVFYSFSRFGYAYVYIIGWDGIGFRSLIDGEPDPFNDTGMDSVYATTPHKLTDTNGDGLPEVVVVYDVKKLCGGMGGLNFCDGTPTRPQITTLGWNGQNYVDLKHEDLAPPQYRFQAVQDGDWQTRYGSYAKALSRYQAAIFDDRLEWWSPERELYEINRFRSQFDPKPTTYPSPTVDTTEYPRLAAYAYYRIMLLHVVQGHESDAGTVYKTVGQKFGNDTYGRPYYEMATGFWEAYQSTHSMYAGCASAIHYATEHPEILVPLGSDYHGSQSHTYIPTDVCPFR